MLRRRGTEVRQARFRPDRREARAELIAKIGENVLVRRLSRVDSDNTLAAYVHGGRIGVLIELRAAMPTWPAAWRCTSRR